MIDFAPVVARDISLMGPRVWSTDSRGFMFARGALTWSGIREYLVEETGVDPRLFGGATRVRVLRRESQVTSDGFLRTLRSLPVTRQHPEENVTAAAVRRLSVGWTSELAVETVAGVLLPVATVKIHDRATQRAIEQGAQQTSLGHVVLFAAAQEGKPRPGGGLPIGQWTAPDGSIQEYDLEQIADPDDERSQRWMRDNPDQPGIGGDHFAIALHAGRGGEFADLHPMVAMDSATCLGAAQPLFVLDCAKSVVAAPDARYPDTDMSDSKLVLDLAAWGRGSLSLDTTPSKVADLVDGLRKDRADLVADRDSIKTERDKLAGEKLALETAQKAHDKALADLKTERDKLAEQAAALEVEVAPLRKVALDACIKQAVAISSLDAAAFAGLSAAEVRTKAIQKLHPQLAADKSQDWIDGVWAHTAKDAPKGTITKATEGRSPIKSVTPAFSLDSHFGG